MNEKDVKFLIDLPTELILIIVDNLDAVSTARLAQTSTFFRDLGLSDLAKTIKAAQDKLNDVCIEFLQEEKIRQKHSRPEFVHSISSVKLMELLLDPNQGIIYTAMLLKKNPKLLSTGSWAEIAKNSLKHAEIIFSNQNIVNELIENQWMKWIADTNHGHASLILKRYGDRLDDVSKPMIEFYAEHNSNIDDWGVRR